MANEQEILYNLIQSLQNDMKSFQKELNETRVLISKYNGLREQMGKRDNTISNLIKKVEGLEDKINYIDNTSKGKQQAFEYIRKWTPWIITVISIIYAYLQIGG